MSMDRSLKQATNMDGKRSVLTRAERIAKMKADKKMTAANERSLGLPKTLVPKS